MLALKNFDGVSSADAPRPDRDSHSGHADLFWADWFFWILKPLAEWLTAGARKKQRQSKVRALKAEVLPLFPESVICPQCLHVEQRC
jgi:hypothetical protein